MNSIISAIGTANPQHCFEQNQILQFMTKAHRLNDNDAARLKTLYELSGINNRYSVLEDFGSASGDYTFFGNEAGLAPFPTTRQRSLVYEEYAKKVAHTASEDLFRQIPDLKPQHITHLITVSCTGMYAPGLDIDLVLSLGLNKSIERTCINFMGCYGAFNALKMADYICRADAGAKVLIVDVELCTLHFQKASTLENWVSNSLFSDGAAAVLVEPESSRSSENGFRMHSFYNELVTEAKDNMGWRIGDTGFEMKLSSKIAKNISSKIDAVTEKLVAKARMNIRDIHHLAVHPGGRRILEVCDEAFNSTLCMKHSFDVLREFGNMSSVTVLFVLKRFLKEVKSGENLLSFAFGPGLTFESMILQAA
ncbi:MAG: type polyketide synthase [Sphingobacteriaceae bacterium]|jgi:predicted naringenin-chalcone synthase|nr:type polyketide synthase [Sphingobacteriaceae bacterium]